MEREELLRIYPLLYHMLVSSKNLLSEMVQVQYVTWGREQTFFNITNRSCIIFDSEASSKQKWKHSPKKISIRYKTSGKWCMLVTVAAIGLGFSFGVKAWTEIKPWYIIGMYSLVPRLLPCM